MTTKYCNLYRNSRVPGPGVVVGLGGLSTNITACGSSDQRLGRILADDPARPTVCTPVLQQVLDNLICNKNYN